MTSQLRDRVEHLYAVFSSAKKPRVIEGCRCCIDDKNVWLLLTRPLREITAEELAPYSSSVFLTVGDVPDFRYLLPRILELMVTDPYCVQWPDPEIIGRALTNASWQEWSTPEREAILDVFHAHFDLFIEEPDGFALSSLVCGLGRAKADLSPFLAKLAAARPALLVYYTANANELPERRLSNSFWGEEPDGMKQVVDWFYSIEIALVILESYGVDLYALDSAQK